MKIDLSKEQGTLVPLYFYRKPFGWPEEERPAAPDRRQTANADRRQTANADRRQTDALNSLMKSRAQDTNHADDCRKYAAEGENEKYEMKN